MGPWCSLINMIPCHGIDHGFKSRRARINGMRYSFCPKCGARLKIGLEHNKKRSICTKCGFVFYQNSKPTASAIISKNGKILMGKRSIEPYKNLWDVPGGFLEYGEAPEKGLRREIMEELGVKIKVKKLVGIFMDTYGKDGDWTMNIYYEAEIISGTPKPDDDVSELKWFNKNKNPKLAFKNGEYAIKKWRKL